MKKKFKEYKQGIYKPINPDKCLNKSDIIYRSHLEFRLMRMCDKNPIVLEWSSEKVIIPYNNPIKGSISRYYVDAYIKLNTPNGPKKYLIEIKPERQTKPPVPSKRKKTSTVLYENATYAVNSSKWESAKQFAKNKGMEFMIITEKDLDRMEGK
jgi:hypothetical protein